MKYDPFQQHFLLELWWNLKAFCVRLTPGHGMDLSADWVTTLVKATTAGRARQTRYDLEKQARLRKYAQRRASGEYRARWPKVGWPPPKAKANVVEDVDHVVQGTFSRTLRRHTLG